jgi:hypothetical protein
MDADRIELPDKDLTAWIISAAIAVLRGLVYTIGNWIRASTEH